MKLGKLLTALTLRVALLALALGVGFAGAAVAMSKIQGTPVSSERDILLEQRPSCVVDSVRDRLQCAAVLHFNGNWQGVKLCRAARCVDYAEVFGGQ